MKVLHLAFKQRTSVAQYASHDCNGKPTVWLSIFFQLALKSMVHLVAYQGCATEVSGSNQYNTEDQVQDSSGPICVAQKSSVIKVLSHTRMS